MAAFFRINASFASAARLSFSNRDYGGGIVENVGVKRLCAANGFLAYHEPEITADEQALSARQRTSGCGYFFESSPSK